ncbi:hypothetical protein FPRO04_14577 [Fusarium proliferatum]|nr:hypothetical protein FPRO04_14577 [Fusarium proliferatum]
MQTLPKTPVCDTQKRMETIEPYALPPWHGRMVVEYDTDTEAVGDAGSGDDVTETSSMRQVLIATSASARNGIVGMGGVVRNVGSGGADDVLAKYSVALGPKDEQNAYTAELEAIAVVLRCMPDGLRHRDVIIATRIRSALQAIAKPRQQSGQRTIREIYKQRLEKGGNTITMRCVSSTMTLSHWEQKQRPKHERQQIADVKQRNHRIRLDRPD